MAVTTTGVFFLFLVAISTFPAKVEPAAAPSPKPLNCMPALGLLLPCFSYVAAPPMNFTETANAECCGTFSSIINSGSGNCLCYLIKEPKLFEFEVNTSRVLSLSKICTNLRHKETLEAICLPSELAHLPPFQNPETTDPDDSDPGFPSETNHTPSSSAGIASPPQPQHTVGSFEWSISILFFTLYVAIIA